MSDCTRVLDFLRRLNWNSFDWPQLANLRYLRDVKLDFLLLRAAVTFWDPDTHVFRFGSQELCPLPEEFEAILGVHSALSASLLLPDLTVPYPNLMCDLFELSASRVNSFTHAHRWVNLGDLCDHASISSPSSSGYQNISCFLLLCCYLLISRSGSGDYHILPLLPKIKQGKNLFPLVLMETLLGLDACKQNVTATDPTAFTGSPLLLQIWLQEKLQLVNPPITTYDKYGPYSSYSPMFYTRRKLKTRGWSFDVWKAYVDDLEDKDIMWMCPWWKLDHVTTGRRGRIFAAGLRSYSSYYPCRVSRQYNVPQTLITGLSKTEVKPLTAHDLTTIERYWGGCDISQHCRAWPGYPSELLAAWPIANYHPEFGPTFSTLPSYQDHVLYLKEEIKAKFSDVKSKRKRKRKD